MYLKKKLNQLTPTVKSKLEQKMDKNINAYRQVRGDGNCFFRALAFSYIANKETHKFDEIFTHLKNVSLTSCQKGTIPKDFQPYYQESLLKEVFRAGWDKEYVFFLKITQEQFGFRNFKRALARMLT
jgi:hypothetical protein